MLVEGYVDLAFREGSSLTVVDFKTDRKFDGALERYQRQVSLLRRRSDDRPGIRHRHFSCVCKFA